MGFIGKVTEITLFNDVAALSSLTDRTFRLRDSLLIALRTGPSACQSSAKNRQHIQARNFTFQQI